MATAHFRGPKPYTPAADFSLWRRRFESYVRAAKIPQDQFCDVLLALLDDATFCIHLIFWDPQNPCKETTSSWSKLSPNNLPQPALCFQLGRHHQEAAETLDEFADALLDLANRAYPELDPEVRMLLARDRFVASM